MNRFFTSGLCFIWAFAASAAIQTVDVGPWGINLEAGEHAVMDGPDSKQVIRVYRGKQRALVWSTKVLGKQTNDSVRKLQKKLKIYSGSVYTETLPHGQKLYRFENATTIFWLLGTGELLTLDKSAISPTTVRFDIQRVSVH